MRKAFCTICFDTYASNLFDNYILILNVMNGHFNSQKKIKKYLTHDPLGHFI